MQSSNSVASATLAAAVNYLVLSEALHRQDDAIPQMIWAAAREMAPKKPALRKHFFSVTRNILETEYGIVLQD